MVLFQLQDNDIALLALTSPIINVRFAKLPLANTTSTYADQLAVVVGWGTTSSGECSYPKLLFFSMDDVFRKQW